MHQLFSLVIVITGHVKCTCYRESLSLSLYEMEWYEEVGTQQLSIEKKRMKEREWTGSLNRATRPNKSQMKVALFKWSSLCVPWNAQMRIIKLCRLLLFVVVVAPQIILWKHLIRSVWGFFQVDISKCIYPFFIIVCQFTAPMSFWKLFLFSLTHSVSVFFFVCVQFRDNNISNT